MSTTEPDLIRALELFDELVELPEHERARRLDALCGDDARARAEVEKLLRADAQRDSALDTVAGGVVGVLADAVSELVAPPRLGRYEIVGELGRGGMGVVYEAQQHEPRRRVALKTLALHASHRGLARVRAEAQAMASLLHVGIPQLYEVFEHAGRPVLAMELVRGRPLREACVELSPRERVGLLVKIADAVIHAHQQGVIHRDLKPGNILVTAAGQPKVLDFGIAGLGDQGVARAGTLAYVAPEQLEGAPPDARNDVYALAALAWELLSGALPIAELGTLTTEQVIARKLAGPAAAPELHPVLSDILNHGLRGPIEARLGSVAGLRAALIEFLERDAVEQLVESAGRELAALRRAIPKDDPSAVINRFAACQFGYRQALTLAPEHAAARRQLDESLQLMARWRMARAEFELAAYHLSEASCVDLALREQLRAAQEEHRRRAERPEPLFPVFAGILFGGAALFLAFLTLGELAPGYLLFGLSSLALIVTGVLVIQVARRRGALADRKARLAYVLISPPIMITVIDVGAWLRGWPPHDSHALALPMIGCTALVVALMSSWRYILITVMNAALWLLSARWPEAIYGFLGVSASFSAVAGLLFDRDEQR